ANTLVSLTKSALNFYDGDGNNAANITASFGKDEVRVGKVGSGNKNVYVTSDGVDIRDDTTSLANFGSTVRVGKADKNYVSIKPTTTDFYIEDPLGTEFPKKVVSIGEGATDFGTSGIDATFLTADGIGVGTIGCTHLIMTGVKDKTAPAIYWHPTDGLQLGKGSYGALDTAWPTTFNEDASIWRTALGLGSAPYLPLSGGTMTGALKVSGGGNLRATMTGIDADSYPSSQLTAHSLTVFDKDGACIGQLRHIQGTDGTMGMALVARQTVNGSVKQNSLGAQVAPDGTRSYIVTDPGAFCEAINVGKTYSATKNMTISTAGIDTWTDGASVSLPAGTYMVVGEWIFQTGSSTGQRNNQVGIRAGSTTYNAQRVLYPNNAYARLQATAIVTLTATTTVKVSASSSMTYATAAATSIDAVRIR
ncbi:MAG: hypothetical protein IJ586_00005, partial [Alloprevotella sp.]|nr:hypothetical protein [Alloprevotella sp.]